MLFITSTLKLVQSMAELHFSNKSAKCALMPVFNCKFLGDICSSDKAVPRGAVRKAKRRGQPIKKGTAP